MSLSSFPIGPTTKQSLFFGGLLGIFDLFGNVRPQVQLSWGQSVKTLVRLPRATLGSRFMRNTNFRDQGNQALFHFERSARCYKGVLGET
jgi:hypothetical protein